MYTATKSGFIDLYSNIYYDEQAMRWACEIDVDGYEYETTYHADRSNAELEAELVLSDIWGQVNGN